MASGQDVVQITASISAQGREPAETVRILRTTEGNSRPAASGDTGLLAQGSDSPEVASWFARTIGLPARQVIRPNETIDLPIRLSVPYPLDTVMSCRPDGGHRDRGRDTLVLSCSLQRTVQTDHLDASIALNGVEEIDVQSGVRLSTLLTGHLNGRVRRTDTAGWQTADDQILYRRETEFE